MSIDENDNLGKRKHVFGMKNRAVLKELKKNENYCGIVAGDLGSGF